MRSRSERERPRGRRYEVAQAVWKGVDHPTGYPSLATLILVGGGSAEAVAMTPLLVHVLYSDLSSPPSLPFSTPLGPLGLVNTLCP